MSHLLHQFLEDYYVHLRLEPGLFYAWENSIRFEISPTYSKNERQKFKQVHERVISLFNQVFKEEDHVLLVTDVYSTSNDRFLERRPLNLYLKYAKNKQTLYQLKHQVHLMENIDDEYGDNNPSVVHRFILPCKKSDIRYINLLKAISYKDYSHNSSILKNNLRNGYDVYFINLTKKRIFHLYDDLGCDVLASDKEDIRFLYEDCKEWILDYDRIQVDHLFEKGLFNVRETENEKFLRVQLNEKKVEEMGINLHGDNTCFISHELEIPLELADECINEISKTGFKINLEHSQKGSVIVKASKIESLALIDYQTELMALYAKKFNGKFRGWLATKLKK